MDAPADPNFAARIRESRRLRRVLACGGRRLDRDVEYKMNILAPGRGSLAARGEVVTPGRTLTVARAEVYARDGKHVATMQQTLMVLAGTPDE
jgi:acyl-coenzyme A thioesterase PaaI-like protein